jgi:hypothetical protein
MNDTPPYSENHPDKMFIWLDKDGIRCGPRHKGIKAALDYLRTWTPLPDNIKTEKDIKELDLSYGEQARYKRAFQYPSQKPPQKLMIGEWIVREPTHDEELKIETAKRLIDEGII